MAKFTQSLLEKRQNGFNDREWSNWAGNVRVRPSGIVRPRSESELVDAVRAAIATGRRIKAVGAGHSFTAIAEADQVLIDLRAYNRVLSVDRSTNRVTVQSGITLETLNLELDKIGLALRNMGDIAYQSIAGAISTGTHGTGRDSASIAAQVVGMRLIDGRGELHDCEIGGDNSDIAHHARVGLGALGLLSTVTLQCVPAFVLGAVHEPMKVDRALDSYDELTTNNEHFEFFWVPHTKWTLSKTHNRIEGPAQPRAKRTAYVNDYVMENYAFGAVCALGKRVPKLIPRLATVLPSSGRVEYSDTSFKVFASPRLVRFVEQEYSIEREALPVALRQIMAMVDRRGFQISFPVEVRFTPADDIPLSTSSGRRSAYIAVHMTKGTPHEEYFAAVEKILEPFGPRPHWGKLHTKSAHDLEGHYEHWQAFLRMRKLLDPDGVFTNPYLDRVLGRI